MCWARVTAGRALRGTDTVATAGLMHLHRTPPSGQQKITERGLGSAQCWSRPRQRQTLWLARRSAAAGDRTVDRGPDPAQSCDHARGGSGSAENLRP